MARRSQSIETDRCRKWLGAFTTAISVCRRCLFPGVSGRKQRPEVPPGEVVARPEPAEAPVPEVVVPNLLVAEPPIVEATTVEPVADPPVGSPAEPLSLLDNRPFAKLAEFCVDLFDELDEASPQFDEPRREVATHVLDRLQDALIACGLEPIDQNAVFDRALHQPVRRTSGIAPGDRGWLARIVSPGFKVDRRVLRRARVEIERITDKGTAL